MRVLVDMSATLLHHGHIRLLKKASEYGSVTIALTSDDEIIKHKGYQPELSFAERSETLHSIRYVDDVIESPWLITNSFIQTHSIDLLVHGSDNSNNIDIIKTIIFERTPGISSTLIRRRVLFTIASKYL